MPLVLCAYNSDWVLDPEKKSLLNLAIETSHKCQMFCLSRVISGSLFLSILFSTTSCIPFPSTVALFLSFTPLFEKSFNKHPFQSWSLADDPQEFNLLIGVANPAPAIGGLEGTLPLSQAVEPLPKFHFQGSQTLLDCPSPGSAGISPSSYPAPCIHQQPAPTSPCNQKLPQGQIPASPKSGVTPAPVVSNRVICVINSWADLQEWAAGKARILAWALRVQTVTCGLQFEELLSPYFSTKLTHMFHTEEVWLFSLFLPSPDFSFSNTHSDSGR